MKKWVISILALLFLSACGGNNLGREANNHPNTITVKNSTIEEVDRKNGQQISKHLVELASSVPNVNDATAVVIGNYALVGIDVDEDIDRSQAGTIKYSVAEALKTDPYGAKAVVIADPDLNARLKEIADDIRKGKPIRGIMNELADISGRLMPEVPADLSDPHEKDPMNKQNDKMIKSETQNLKDKQIEQSNHHLKK